MTAFTWLPSYGATRDKTVRQLEARFGDGYSQRVGDGINIIKRVWNVPFDYRTQSEADAIDAYLELYSGGASFAWTDPDGYTGKWICRQWNRTPVSATVFSIAAVFEQVFE
jgi:phage-related protein